MDHVKLLEEVTNAFGAPGFEDEIRNIIYSKIKDLASRVHVDALGNLMAFRPGKKDLTLMVDSHLDEVAFMVSHIDNDGYLRLVSLGGWDQRILPSHAITISPREGQKVQGIIGSVPPHILSSKERKKVISLEDMFVDVGAISRAEVLEMGIRVGDPAIMYYPFVKMNEHTVRGKAFDNRAGCALGVLLLEALKDVELPWNLAVNFAVCEEVGLRGATTAAYQIDPDLALVLEGTIGADVPGVKEQKKPTSMGKGPAITVADKRTIVPRELVILLEDLARQKGLPFQHKTPGSGGTDGGAIHLSRGGVPTAIISVPCRYIHSPLSLMRLEDFRHTLKLAEAFVLEGVGQVEEKISQNRIHPREIFRSKGSS